MKLKQCKSQGCKKELKPTEEHQYQFKRRDGVVVNIHPLCGHCFDSYVMMGIRLLRQGF